jgi:hypothetical protein
MAPRNRVKVSRKPTQRQRAISVSIQLRCHALPARWATISPGVLSYAPMTIGRLAVDPWQVRENFISLQHDIEQLLNFLNSVGSWDLLPSANVRDYWEWQDIFKIVHLHPTNWRTAASDLDRDKLTRLSGIPSHHLTLESSRDLKKAIFSCSNLSVLDAIIASVHLDEAKLLRRRPSKLKRAR